MSQYPPKMGNNLKELRARKEWTQDRAATAMGVSRGQYIKLERGERRLTDRYITLASQAFDVPETAVFGPMETETVPIVGQVGAGSEAHYYAESQGPFDEAPMPEFGSTDTVAVEVRGDSLGALFNQWLVYYDDVRTPPTSDLLGRLCVVGLVDGRVLVKKLMRGSRPGAFHLFSVNESPIEDAEIEWAARVTGMVPR